MTYWIRQYFTRPKIHGRTLSEVLVIAIFALLPLLISALVINYNRSETFDLSAGLDIAVGGGQLYLYAYSLFGTILWLSFIKWDRAMSGPRRLLGLVAIVMAFLIVGLVGVDPTISNSKNEFIITASYFAYGTYLLIQYLLLFYLEIQPPSAEDSLRSGAKDLKDKYENLAREKNASSP